jgi:DNA-binding response OmpR family regulator
LTGQGGPPILAVEDEPRNAALLRAILAPAGYALTIAATLAEARASVRDRMPALVLLDRHLPDGDGLDLARELRASTTTGGIPILLVSASVLPIDRVAAEEAGCAGFIDKPVRVDALLAEVARHLEASAGGSAGPAGDPKG